MKDYRATLMPPWLAGYQRRWLTRDVIAGAALAAIAIPEVMGYTAIAKTPIATGLYTLIIPVIIFAIIGASRLLVVGASAGVAALMAAGLGGAEITGLLPGSSQWLAYTSVIALICGVFLILARIFRLGFLSDFISVPITIGLLAGIGIQIATSQIPEMLGLPAGTGSWLDKQWHTITTLNQLEWLDVAFALGTAALVVGCQQFFRRVPGGLIAIVLSIIVSAIFHASNAGVAVIGDVPGGLPLPGLPEGISLSDIRDHFRALVLTGFACFIMIMVESSVTVRAFAMVNGDRVQLNRDILGLAGSNLAAGLSGTFAVGGSASKTKIVDEESGHSQFANLTMALLTLMTVLIFTSFLTNLPKAVLGTVVFLIGCRLIDHKGLKRILRQSPVEFVAAIVTAVVACVLGIEVGMALAIIMSILHTFKRQYRAKAYVVGLNSTDDPTYFVAKPGLESSPGLIVYRFNATLFYANANRFADDVYALIDRAPSPVEWFILDGSSLAHIDYSAGVALEKLFDFLEARGVKIVLARADFGLVEALTTLELAERIPPQRRYGSLPVAYAAFNARRT